MFAEERRFKIAQIIQSGQSVKVAELSRTFEVSEATIRRDLVELENSGHIVRTHGGAVGSITTNFEPSFSEKQERHLEEKEYIGKIAASYINDGETVILDSGTTTQFIAKYITAKNITIITNSTNLANELSHRQDIEVIITGGSVRPLTRAMVGPIAEATLRQFRVDKAFVGANGISIKSGVTTPNYMEACTKRAMVEVAKEVFLAADSSKFGEISFSLIAQVSKFNYIITDKMPEDVRFYRDLGVEIVTNAK